MKITEVRVFPTESKDGKLKAFATMTFDDWFVVRNVKVIQGNNGLFVAMPSRKAVDSCRKCGFKNARGSKFCNECGAKLGRSVVQEDIEGRKQSVHMDIAHPVTQECRVYIQKEILDAYQKEFDRKKTEGSAYKPVTEEDLNAAAEGSAREEKRRDAEIPGLEETEGQDIAL
jgi:stage V sporulation protein G